MVFEFDHLNSTMVLPLSDFRVQEMNANNGLGNLRWIVFRLSLIIVTCFNSNCSCELWFLPGWNHQKNYEKILL